MEESQQDIVQAWGLRDSEAMGGGHLAALYSQWGKKHSPPSVQYPMTKLHESH